MPIYEYECEKCGKVFEEIVSSYTNDTLPCPKCKSKHTKKLMSRVGGIASGKLSTGPACSTGAACPGAHTCGAGSCCAGM